MNTGDRRLDQHTGAHQREGRAAHGGHQCRVLGLGDLKETRAGGGGGTRLGRAAS